MYIYIYVYIVTQLLLSVTLGRPGEILKMFRNKIFEKKEKICLKIYNTTYFFKKTKKNPTHGHLIGLYKFYVHFKDSCCYHTILTKGNYYQYFTAMHKYFFLNLLPQGTCVEGTYLKCALIVNVYVLSFYRWQSVQDSFYTQKSSVVSTRWLHPISITVSDRLTMVGFHVLF